MREQEGYLKTLKKGILKGHLQLHQLEDIEYDLIKNDLFRDTVFKEAFEKLKNNARLELIKSNYKNLISSLKDQKKSIKNYDNIPEYILDFCTTIHTQVDKLTPESKVKWEEFMSDQNKRVKSSDAKAATDLLKDTALPKPSQLPPPNPRPSPPPLPNSTGDIKTTHRL